MPKLDEQSPQNKISVTFCDKSTNEKTFDHDSWGDIDWRDAYHSLISQGRENNTIWAIKPHIVKVTATSAAAPEDVLVEHFTCDCVHAKERASA